MNRYIEQKRRLGVAVIKFKLSNEEEIWIRADGSCMEPVLRSGDELLIKKQEEYSIGDIVLINFREQLRVHRIIVQNDFCVLCKGDLAFSSEEINKNQILGKVLLLKQGTKIKKYRGLTSKYTSSISREIHLMICNKMQVEEIQKTWQYRYLKEIRRAEDEFDDYNAM